MKTNEKKLNVLGLATRARHLVSGDELVQAAIDNHSVYLVFCAKDASENTLKRFKLRCERNNIPLNLEFTKYEISHAIGKSRTIVALSNKGMAKLFQSYTLEESEEFNDN